MILIGLDQEFGPQRFWLDPAGCFVGFTLAELGQKQQEATKATSKGNGRS
jgi:20S proteasome alpha/beta subunit